MNRPPTLHPELSRERRRELFLAGIDLFNNSQFFDSHEVWEEIWRSTTPEPKDLFQGLIQVAVGFYHFHAKKRPDVACRVLAKGRRRILPFAPESHGLDLAKLTTDVDAWCDWLADSTGRPPAAPRLRVVDSLQVC